MSPNDDKPRIRDERIAALRLAIAHAFPAVSYTGSVTRCDGAWLPELTEENAIHDDDKFLYEALKSRKWTDVPKTFLSAMPGDFVLLTDEALVAFLAAWLVCSLDDIESENVVREHVVYAFSPSSVTAEFIADRLRALSREQRFVIRSLLVEFAEIEPSNYVQGHVANAVAFIDSFATTQEEPAL